MMAAIRGEHALSQGFLRPCSILSSMDWLAPGPFPENMACSVIGILKTVSRPVWPLGPQYLMLVWMIWWRWAEVGKSGGQEAGHTLCDSNCPLGIRKCRSLRISCHRWIGWAGCCILVAVSVARSEFGARQYMGALLLRWNVNKCKLMRAIPVLETTPFSELSTHLSPESGGKAQLKL
jgi:hypothetical protein